MSGKVHELLLVQLCNFMMSALCCRKRHEEEEAVALQAFIWGLQSLMYKEKALVGYVIRSNQGMYSNNQ